MIARRRFLAMAASLPAGLAMAGRARSGTVPGEVVRAFYDVLLGAMRDGPAIGYAGRYGRLEPAIVAAFNLPYMTRLAVGRKWTGLSDADKARLVDAFARYTVAHYANQFDRYAGQSFEVGEDVPIDDGRIITESKMIRTKGAPIAFNYLLRQESGDWRIVDVLLDGTLSQLAARRAEFGAVIARDGIEGLVRALEAKILELSVS